MYAPVCHARTKLARLKSSLNLEVVRKYTCKRTGETRVVGGLARIWWVYKHIGCQQGGLVGSRSPSLQSLASEFHAERQTTTRKGYSKIPWPRLAGGI